MIEATAASSASWNKTLSSRAHRPMLVAAERGTFIKNTLVVLKTELDSPWFNV